MLKSSASSVVVCSSAAWRRTRCFSCFALSFGCLPRSRPRALAIFMPSRVRMRMTSEFEFGDQGEDVEQQSPTGSVGSWIEPPRLRRMSRAMSSSTMSLASGSDRARRSSWGLGDDPTGGAIGEVGAVENLRSGNIFDASTSSV